MLSLLNDALEWLDRAEEARIVAGQLTDPTARKAVLQPKPMCVSEPRLGQFVPTTRSTQQAPISRLASTTTTANGTEEPRHMVSALIYVISVTLIAAATIVSFGIASFSFLNTSNEMPSSGIRDWGVELKPVLSGVVPYTHANAATVPAETTFPTPAVEATLRASPPDGAAAHNMQPPGVSGPQPGSEQPGLGTSAASATEDASRSGTMPTLPIPAAQRDQVFREFEMLLSNNAGFRVDRLRKECGPIKDPQLLGDCVRSFRAQYPVR